MPDTIYNDRGRTNLSKYSVIETDNVVVYPDSLPVCRQGQGVHVLAVPRRHRYSFAQSPDLETELGRVRYQLELRARCSGLMKPEDDLVLFEHGGTSYGSSVLSVYHQHCHLISSSGYDVLAYMNHVLSETIDNQGNRLSPLLVDVPHHQPVRLLTDYFGAEIHPYIFVQRGRQGLLVIDQDNALPSQVSQRAMTKLLSGRELSWKQLPPHGEDQELADLAVRRVVSIVENVRSC